MENATDALKMVGAALLFIIAFSIAMTMFSKARVTTDAILDNLKINDFFPKVQSLKNNTTREVGIETIIPTLYRYAQSDENFRVLIIDTDGTELQIFDQNIENIVHGDPDESDPYESKINAKYNDSGKLAYLYGAPWAGQNAQNYRVERINAYINGTVPKHMPDVKGYENNYLMKYKDRRFDESYIEYRTDGKIYEDEFGEEIVEIPASTKVIITYKLK